MKDYFVTATVRFVVKAGDEVEARAVARGCFPTYASKHDLNKELGEVIIEEVEDVTDEDEDEDLSSDLDLDGFDYSGGGR